MSDEEPVDVWLQTKQMASVFGEIRTALIVEGFTAEEAFVLCHQMLANMGNVQ